VQTANVIHPVQRRPERSISEQQISYWEINSRRYGLVDAMVQAVVGPCGQAAGDGGTVRPR